MRKITMTVALLVSLSSSTQAQTSRQALYQVVLPGSDALDPARISPHKVRYERPGGFMNYELYLTELEGRTVYQLDVYFNQEIGVPDKMYFDPNTLAYVGRRLETLAYTVDVRLIDNRMTGELTPTAGSDYKHATYDKAFDHGGFEPAMMNYWIAALPLEEGYTASLPVFDLNRGSEMHWSNIRVVGRESIKIDDRVFDTWKVESQGIKDKTIWVTTTEPYAIKMITEGSVAPWLVTKP